MDLSLVISFILLHTASGTLLDSLMPTENYAFSKQLSEDTSVFLYWKYEQISFTFELHVKTKGWVGFGISPTGSMLDADIMIGWVSDGTATITDRYATGNVLPELDPDSQDWHLLSGYETDTYTVLKFWRYHTLCDVRDVNITRNPTYDVIWAYGDEDGDATELKYHTARGAVELDLFAYNASRLPIPADATNITFTNTNVEIPTSNTTYWCEMFKIPDGDKQHIIAVDPIITPGLEALIQHILIYACYNRVDGTAVGQRGLCSSDDMRSYSNCNNPIAGWAVGASTVYLPEEAGLPISGGEKPFYVRMETHFTNFAMTTGLTDSSGVRLVVTPTLRQYDAGILMTGMNVRDNHIIPPGSPAWLSAGFCTQDCLSQMGQDVHAFMAILYAKQTATSLKLRHFRQLKEMPPIMQDLTYDSDYQRLLNLNKPVTIERGDYLRLECTYNTTGRTSVIHGGGTVEDEACLAFLLYYPKQDIYSCRSMPTAAQIAFSAGFTIDADYMVVTPAVFAGRTLMDAIDSLDWTNPTIKAKFQRLINSGEMKSSCGKRGGRQNRVDYLRMLVPRIGTTFVEDDASCHRGVDVIPASLKGRGSVTSSSTSISIIAALVAMVIFR